MITINKDATNSVIFTLTEKSVIPVPNYLFSFTNDNSGVSTLFNMTDTSSYPRRYNQFDLIEDDGECKRAFSIPDLYLDFDASGVTIGMEKFFVGYSTGTPTVARLDIEQYENGVLINIDSSAGGVDDPQSFLYDANTSWTLSVRFSLEFDDGVINTFNILFELDLTGTPSFIVPQFADIFITYDCVTYDGLIDEPEIIDFFSGSPVPRSLDTRWFDGDGATIAVGDAYIGVYPYEDLSWTFGLDVTQWPDLPLDFDMSKIGYQQTFIEGRDDPSLGEVNLEYGWGKYEVYEAITATLSIAGTTGRILEEGKYFVSGYPVNYSSEIDNIYL